MQLLAMLKKHFPPIILLLALLSAFPPLATDMYLPALPLLQREWQAPLVTINLTLVAFFVTYCAFLLLYGPLSDRYGRRPPLLVGVAVFIVACLLCSVAQSPGMLICGRILQGAGAAAASAIVFAVSKDRFSGLQRQRVFVQIGAIVAAAPMIAPILGGWTLTLFSWRWIFLLQALLGTIALAGVWRMDESLRQHLAPSLIQVAASYLRLFANGRYMLLLLTLSFTCVPVFAFIGGSPDLYITRLGFNERQFSYFFGFNALAFVLAPLTFSRVARHTSVTRLLPWAFTGMLAASLLLLCPWIPLPWRLTLPMFGLTFAFSFCRPASNNLILEQVDRDTGAASSLMVFFYFMVGALSMWLFSLEWPDKIRMLGWMGVAAVGCTLALWPVAKRRLRQVAE
ncbi:MAG: multidrug effflux MFS transporter [Desulfobulbus sp.]|uniref:multidrug effflux MFS transporter n=1 Tax=Desulfobulbus sp. TaxID=895 RepID=UPI00284349FE|nr:multidrug effflux MFS transporter [Desulfobulbus sp.]MDR2548823.1 multidrug effflux MFS transporter [Desulfobulbus sp.]